MRKTSIVFLVIALIGSLFSSLTTLAATTDDEMNNPFEFALNHEGYDYSISFENYADKFERVFGYDLALERQTVLEIPVFATPSADEDDYFKSLNYQFETNNPDARYVTVEFASHFGGQLAFHEAMELVDGRVSQTFDISSPEDEIITVTIYIHNENNIMIFYLYNIHFLFDSFNHSELMAFNKPQAAESATAKPTTSKVYVGDEEVSFQAYLINGNNYFKLRDLAMIMNDTPSTFAIGWDGENNAITIETDEPYEPVGGELSLAENLETQTAKLSTSTIYFNGEQVQVTAYTINGNNYVKLRDIAAMIDFDVYYYAKNNSIHLDPWHFYSPDMY